MGGYDKNSYPHFNSAESYYFGAVANQLKSGNFLRLYFDDGISPLEFDDAFSAMERNEVSVFPWELALRLALEEKGISVSYDNGYCITDHRGRRINPSFESRNSAEKLFIKLIFPKHTI